MNYFDAPDGATLDANTTYFVVFEGTGDSADDFVLDNTRATMPRTLAEPTPTGSSGTRGGGTIPITPGGRSLMISIHGSEAVGDTGVTGQPVITGAAQVGRILTAEKGTICGRGRHPQGRLR